jgi:hypothetical protein
LPLQRYKARAPIGLSGPPFMPMPLCNCTMCWRSASVGSDIKHLAAKLVVSPSKGINNLVSENKTMSDNRFLTMERLALIEVRRRFPDLQRKGFHTAVRESCGSELAQPIGFIPDGWFVEGDHINSEDRGEPATFTCVEIENQHLLSRDKLWRYCELADLLDFCGHNLRLFVFDRYGLNGRELCLLRLFYVPKIETAHDIIQQLRNYDVSSPPMCAAIKELEIEISWLNFKLTESEQ